MHQISPDAIGGDIHAESGRLVFQRIDFNSQLEYVNKIHVLEWLA